jgi:hypothetical protein
MKLLLLCTTALWPGVALAAEPDGHVDPVGHVALALVVILVVAKLGGDLAVRFGQPAVLGELVGGVVVGNLSLLGFAGLESLKTDPSIDMLSRLGVLILLFEVGLESTVGQMLKVGVSSLLVATLGVAAPFALGWCVGGVAAAGARAVCARLPRGHPDRDERWHHGSSAQRSGPLPM